MYFPSSALANEADVQGSEKTFSGRFSGRMPSFNVAGNAILRSTVT